MINPKKMMDRIIILSVFACFILYDWITWTPHKTDTKPVKYSSEFYDPATGVFSIAGTMEVKRAAPRILLLYNGKSLITGRLIHQNNQDTILSRTEFYDLNTGAIIPVYNRLQNLSGL